MFTVELRVRNHADAGTQKVTIDDPKAYAALIDKINQAFPDIVEDYNLLMATTPSISLDLYGGQTNIAQNGTPIDVGQLKVWPYTPELLALIQENLQ
ncbi:hypothetical protein ACFQ5M_04665 [Agrilactobacillus yilanensis]|uniref:Uncharacterized protein n=1 Tax=Agrilactobacillus yilanensis TaxID=2485997 RepID=A0ABW4J4U1_9LACO|nr:hypothetical protein [Agrilactobacillus yilanensis]